jgi:phenylalanyl-tRNA synthetase beta chain
MDIMHPVDLIEDAAISYGYGNFGATPPRVQTIGGLTPLTTYSDLLSELFVGYGYSQVVTFMISGSRFEYERMGMEPSGSVEIMNPVLEEYNMLRSSLLPGMLLLLEANKHNELPQKIFEVGDVHMPASSTHLAAMSIHPRAAFAEIRSLADAINRDMKMGLRMADSIDPRFIEGRQMSMRLDGEIVGILGELHPEVITNFNLYNPIVALEMDVQKALKLR